MAQGNDNRPHRRWAKKFADAFRGARIAIRGQRSFLVHLPVAVLAAAAGMRVSLAQSCILILCITAVLAAEMFNSALESLAKAITREHDERIRDALDVASAAVLVASIGAVVVGAIVFGLRLAELLGWLRVGQTLP